MVKNSDITVGPAVLPLAAITIVPALPAVLAEAPA
jgi:hypothetical protein